MNNDNNDFKTFTIFNNKDLQYNINHLNPLDNKVIPNDKHTSIYNGKLTVYSIKDSEYFNLFLDNKDKLSQLQHKLKDKKTITKTSKKLINNKLVITTTKYKLKSIDDIKTFKPFTISFNNRFVNIYNNNNSILTGIKTIGNKPYILPNNPCQNLDKLSLPQNTKIITFKNSDISITDNINRFDLPNDTLGYWFKRYTLEYCNILSKDKLITTELHLAKRKINRYTYKNILDGIFINRLTKLYFQYTSYLTTNKYIKHKSIKQLNKTNNKTIFHKTIKTIKKNTKQKSISYSKIIKTIKTIDGYKLLDMIKTLIDGYYTHIGFFSNHKGNINISIDYLKYCYNDIKKNGLLDYSYTLNTKTNRNKNIHKTELNINNPIEFIRQLSIEYTKNNQDLPIEILSLYNDICIKTNNENRIKDKNTINLNGFILKVKPNKKYGKYTGKQLLKLYGVNKDNNK